MVPKEFQDGHDGQEDKQEVTTAIGTHSAISRRFVPVACGSRSSDYRCHGQAAADTLTFSHNPRPNPTTHMGRGSWLAVVRARVPASAAGGREVSLDV